MNMIGPGDVGAQLELVEERARRRMWWWFPAIAIVGGVGGVAFGRVVGTRPDHHRHHGNTLLGVVVAVGVVLLVVVALLVVRRRRGRLFPPVPLGFGLTRIQRREVKQDLRRGTPSADPVLAEVERRVVARVLRQSRHTNWLYPIVLLAMGVNVVLPDRTTAGRVLFGLFFVAFAVTWPYQRRHLRRLRAFPGPTASRDGGGVHG